MATNMGLGIFSNMYYENRLIVTTLSEALNSDHVDMTDDDLMEEVEGLINYANNFIEKNGFNELWYSDDNEEEIEHYRQRWDSINAAFIDEIPKEEVHAGLIIDGEDKLNEERRTQRRAEIRRLIREGRWENGREVVDLGEQDLREIDAQVLQL